MPDTFDDNGSDSSTDKVNDLGMLPYTETQFKLPDGLGGSVADTFALPEFNERGDPVGNRSGSDNESRAVPNRQQATQDNSVGDDPLAEYLAWEASENGTPETPELQNSGDGEPGAANLDNEPGADQGNGDGSDTGAEADTRLDKHPRFREMAQQKNHFKQQNELLTQQLQDYSQRLAAIENERNQQQSQLTIDQQVYQYEQEVRNDNLHIEDEDALERLIAAEGKAKRYELTQDQQRSAWEQQQAQVAQERYWSDLQTETTKYPTLAQRFDVQDESGQTVAVGGAELVQLVAQGALANGNDIAPAMLAKSVDALLSGIAENRAKQISSERIEAFFKARGGAKPNGSNPAANGQKPRTSAPPVLNNRNGGNQPPPAKPADATRLTGSIFGNGVRAGVFDSLDN